MGPHISIVVPVFNNGQDISRCLDSILAQTIHEIEIIVVNDGSSDNSGIIINEYQNKYSSIKVIHQENQGVTAARMSGVSLAKGEFIGFVDGDDYVEPQMFERLYENALIYHADISHCGYQMCFQDGRVHYFYNTGCLVEYDRTTALKELLSGSRIEPGLCNKLYHKTLFQSLLQKSIMPVNIKINEDLLMNYYLFNGADKSVYEDICPYHYIVRAQSASRQRMNEHMLCDPIRVKEIIASDICDELSEVAYNAYAGVCIRTYNILAYEKSNEYGRIFNDVKNRIKNIDVKRLGTKKHITVRLIVYYPGLYKMIYLVYKKIFQKNLYA